MKKETEYPIDIHSLRLELHLKDDSYPLAAGGIKEKRLIARGVIFDGTKMIFASVKRNDMFGQLSFLETSGGGVRKNETVQEGVLREIEEEMGIKGEIVCFLGYVEDYYNLIGRMNMNYYFLVRKLEDVPSHKEKDEIEDFHLERKTVTYEEAMKVYEDNRNTKLGHLLYQRETPIISLAKTVIDSYGLM